MTIEYTARDLNAVADYFETLANDQLCCVRFQGTKQAKVQCQTEARMWNEAAKILRQTSLKGEGREAIEGDL